MRGSKGYVILGFRVPTTSVGTRGEVVRGSKGVREQGRLRRYAILGFRVPHHLCGGEGVREQSNEGEQGVCYTRF